MPPMIISPPGYVRRTSASVTFTGAANLGATGTNTPFFTVTGEVLIVYLVPTVVLTLGESAASSSIALGVTNSTGLFIGATSVTTLVTGEFWTEATGGGAPNAGVGLPAAGTAAPQLKDVAITANILTAHTGVGNTNSGTLRLDCYYVPLSSDGLVA